MNVDLVTKVKICTEEVTIDILVEVVNFLEKCTAEQRVDFLYRIRQLYCIYCGNEIDGICYCTNDE